ncbi:MAG: glycoside hydrolase family 65 protein [Lachnospiraceae bacterium]|jgi:trehalose/maltose hydrolase-like predicted phosphorylase
MINYTKGTGELTDWLIEETVFNEETLGKCEAIFCQGNGYLGVRNALEESYLGETRDLLVNGTFNKAGENEVTELPNLPDITAMEIRIDGERYALDRGTVREYSRVMNLKNGEVTRHTVWRSRNGAEVTTDFRRVVSLPRIHVIAAQAVLSADRDVTVSIESGINGRMTNTGSQHCEEGTCRMYDGRCLEMVGGTNQSRVAYAIHTQHNFFLDGEPVSPEAFPVIDRRKITARYQIRLPAGSKLTVEKISCVHTGRDLVYDGLSAEETLKRLKTDSKAESLAAAELGYEKIAAESAEAWKNFWDREDVKIGSENPFDQLAVRFALYHLNIMQNKDDSREGIGAKGLTGEGYKGHSFWDTEIFIFPFFLMTDPSRARTLLEYRYKNLYGARKKAAEHKLQGAMYPWESAWIDDGEVTPLWGAADIVTGESMPILTGFLEIHISADIAYAVDEYYRVTGDEDFMDRYGDEMILDTARFWLSRMTWNDQKNRYEILDVIGPDEYKEHINNNAYTNYMAAHNIHLAEEVLKKIKKDKPEVYSRLRGPLQLDQMEKDLPKARRLYLPQPNEDGIIPQFDGYLDLKSIDLTKYKESSVVGTIYNDYNNKQINTFQVSKQGDTVVLLELLGDQMDPEIRRKNFVYYEARTLHDSSLSKSTHCVLAADLGMDDMAYKFYEGAAAVDLGQQMKSSDMGVHTAAMGGIWQAAVYGFGGLRPEKDSVRVSPRLPKQWKTLSYPAVIGGARVTVNADHEKVRITCSADSAKPARLTVYGSAEVIEPGETKEFAV